jgi:pilus assembly protein CpaE
MAQLTALIVTSDEEFRREIGQLLRSSGVPVGVVEGGGRVGADAAPDVALIDIRRDTVAGLSAIERLRGTYANLGIFAVAARTDPDLILQAMRAGANEFFTWPPASDPFHGAIRRTAARRESAKEASRPPSSTIVFLGAKGGVGTTTIAVNSAVEIARVTHRQTIIVDLKSCLGEVALFLGVRPRFTLLDAIENLHRLDRDFLKELVAKHKSGLEILAASEQFDRPGAQDAGAVEELFRVLARGHDFIVVDVGNSINSCALAALYAADRIFLVTNPDVPSVRNAQRLIDRVRQLGAGAERVRIVLNRAAENLMIGPKQIETALGYAIHQTFSSDYKTVSTALNSGVPLACANHTELAAQFDRFTRDLIGPSDPAPEREPEKKRVFLGLF